MFIYSPTQTPGEKHEIEVLNAFDNYFRAYEKKEWFGFLHHQAFYRNQDNNISGRYEPDLLIFEKNKGLTIVEVKGIRIENIKSINGQIWYYNDFYEKSGNPYSQAEKQLHYISNQLEEDSLLYRQFSKRALIALPNITQDEWDNSKFSTVKNLPPILFKNDLKNINKLNMIYDFNLRKIDCPMDELRWKRTKKFFNIEGSTYKGNKKSKQGAAKVTNRQFIFSKLFIVESMEFFRENFVEIKVLLSEGTKVYILTNQVEVSDTIERHFKKFQNYLLITDLNVKAKISDFQVTNGKLSKEIEESIVENFENFNIKQYKIAHADNDAHIIVTASAGTGKTFTMIDRILYLLLIEEVKPEEISMITFTNESTEEMRSRLQERLILQYELTNKLIFLQLAESTKKIQISTIHKFGKSIIANFSEKFGLGQNFKVTGFQEKRKEIIDQLINEYSFKNPEFIENIIKKKIDYYKLVVLILKFWNEMEKKGFSKESIQAMDWGTEVLKTKKSIEFNAFFKYLFSNVEEKIAQVKMEANALETNDLIRNLNLINADSNIEKRMRKGRYLFIDEFQDSDDAQIKFIAELANKLDYRLFVVGDVKQAIYRFRGANNKAFDVLEKELKTSRGIIKETLIHNYRSNGTLLMELERFFINWGEHKLIPYVYSKDRVIPNKNYFIDNPMRITKVNNKEYWDDRHFASHFIKKLDSILKKSPQKAEVGIIVRTNKQAKQIEKICKENNIFPKTSLDGTFYQSSAVKHFKYVIEMFMFPSDVSRVVRAMHTPYFGYIIPVEEIVPFNGDSNKILNRIKKLLDFDFDSLMESLKTTPLLTVMQTLVIDDLFYQRVYQYYKIENPDFNNEEIIINLNQYKKNLHYLFDIINNNFSIRDNNLYIINNWLEINMHTNKKENEPVISESKEKIEITTVHRAKGKEFEHVLLPYTSNSFNGGVTDPNLNGEIYFNYDNSGTNLKTGWSIVKDSINSPTISHNNYFDDFYKINKEENVEEEMRLLYVALTRAKKSISILTQETPSEESWGYFLTHKEDQK